MIRLQCLPAQALVQTNSYMKKGVDGTNTHSFIRASLDASRMVNASSILHGGFHAAQERRNVHMCQVVIHTRRTALTETLKHTTMLVKQKFLAPTAANAKIIK